MDLPPPPVSFDNTENAFEYKSDRELKKAAFLFSSMGYTSLVKLGTRLTPWMIRSRKQPRSRREHRVKHGSPRVPPWILGRRAIPTGGRAPR